MGHGSGFSISFYKHSLRVSLWLITDLFCVCVFVSAALRINRPGPQVDSAPGAGHQGSGLLVSWAFISPFFFFKFQNPIKQP